MGILPVLQLSKFYKPCLGGIESVVADISEGSKADVTVIACSADMSTPAETINSVKVIRAKSWGLLASMPVSPGYIFQSVRNTRGQILHIHHPNPLANLALFAAWLLRKDISKLVVHWHSDIVKQRLTFLLYRPLMNWMLSRTRVIIVTSQPYLHGSEQLVKYIDKAVVVPIGSDSLQSKVNDEEVRRIRAAYSGSRLVFSLGRHIYYKGFEYLIEAAARVDNVTFLIGGSGPDTAAYRRRIVELGLESRVVLLGRIDEQLLPSYYAAADVFCMPSTEKSEAYGVVQLEAMSVGTPVISTDIPGSGVPWVNRHGVSGLLCEPRDVESLVSALKRVLGDEELRSSLSRGAKERYLLFFQKEEMVKAIEVVYSELSLL